MAYVLCLQKMHLISVKGHSMILEDSPRPQQVPDECLPELFALGCVQCDEEGNVIVTGKPLAVRYTAPADPELRAPEPGDATLAEVARIDDAVKAAVESGDKGLMDTRYGVPKVIAITERVGFKVTRAQIVDSCKRLGYI